MKDIEWKKRQIGLFYRYLKPSASSLLIFDHETKTYSSEYLIFTPNEEAFINQTLKYNERGDCFAARNRFHTQRITENITFLKTWVIDIDDDIDGAKSFAFEELCKKYDLYIEAKAKSREEGGWHYYIPYKPTDITDKNRQLIIQIGRSLRDWLTAEHNIDIDTKIFDLPRLIRVWGTINHKRNSYCEVVKCKTADQNQIEHNTRFINSLLKEKTEQATQTANFVTSCPLVEFVRHESLTKTGTQKNDKLLKNISIFLFQTLGQDGLKIAEEIAIKQNHNPAEARGWWEKAKEGKLSQFSCGELNLWIKKHYPELMSQTCTICRLCNKNKVEYLSGNESFYNLKKMAREKQKLFINKEVFLRGIVCPSTVSYKQEVTVFKYYQKESSNEIIPEEIIVFFDERQPSSKWREVRGFGVDFFIYEFINEGVQHTLLSERKLDYGEYFIEGNIVKITDQVLIGNYGKIKSKKKIILVNSAKSMIQKIPDHQHLFSLTNGITGKDYLDYIFSYFNKNDNKHYIFRQPENINRLMVGFLFSAKFDYPLHLCFYGNPDSGKSTILTTIFSKFNEPYQIIDGSISSLKGLVPSFSKSVPEIGAVLESKRICAVDEFFRIIKNKDEDEDKISMLNNLLLHTEYSHRTGKGKIDATMSSKLFIVTNPLYGCDFIDTIARLPPSTMDRILLWKQYKEHYNWVRLGKHKIEEKAKIDKYFFLSIYDYLSSFQIKFDQNRLDAIVREIRAKCPDFMLGFYDARYASHHSKCLLDGITKFRCLIEKDESFASNEKDYQEFKKLWDDIVVGWTVGEINDMILTEEQKEMLDVISKNKDIWDYQLEKVCLERNIEFKHNYKRLLNLKYIKVLNRAIIINEEKEVSLGDVGGEDIL